MHAMPLRLRAVIAMIAVAASLAIAAPAMAASSGQSGYSSTGERAQQQAQAQPKSHALPFTGLDLVAVLVVSASLMVVGVALHRVAKAT